jgi:glycosyltransferase involved in cell wall biosynthesis
VKLSVLLPTKEGGAQLDIAMGSVLGSTRTDIELVVSDNASGPETVAVIDRWRHDPRLVAVRQPSPVPVAANWQSAFDASSGDHLLVIGDDDALLPVFFDRIASLLADTGAEAVTYNAHGFIACGALPGDQRAQWSERLFSFDAGLRSASLTVDDRRRLVDELFRFRPHLPLNMQATVFSRVAAARVPAPLFRAPFPDHFALASMLLTARSWAVVDEPLLVVGLTPKSFGHYAYGSREAEGLGYLGIETDFAGRFAGDSLLNGMYRWLLLLKDAFPNELGRTTIDRGEYLLRQLWWLFRQRAGGGLSTSAALRRATELGPADWLRVGRALLQPTSLRRAAAGVARMRRPARWVWGGARPLDGICDAREFIAWLARTP